MFFGIQNEREWLVLCRDILRQADLAADPRFATNPDRVAHHDELTAIIERPLAGRTADEVSAGARGGGDRQRPAARRPRSSTRHPQLVARDRWRRSARRAAASTRCCRRSR